MYFNYLLDSNHSSNIILIFYVLTIHIYISTVYVQIKNKFKRFPFVRVGVRFYFLFVFWNALEVR